MSERAPENTRAIRNHMIVSRPGDDDWGTSPDYEADGSLTVAQKCRHLAENPAAFPPWPEGERTGLTEAERNEMNSYERLFTVLLEPLIRWALAPTAILNSLPGRSASRSCAMAKLED